MASVVKLDDFRKNRKNVDPFELDRFRLIIKSFGLQDKYDSCCICGWDKGDIHFSVMSSTKDHPIYTFDNVLPACPNHHYQFNENKVESGDIPFIQEFLWTVCNELTPFYG